MNGADRNTSAIDAGLIAELIAEPSTESDY